MTRTTVMLVDDHAVVRVGFRLLLQAAEDLLVVAEADSGEQAITLYHAGQTRHRRHGPRYGGRRGASRPSSASSRVMSGPGSWPCRHMRI